MILTGHILFKVNKATSQLPENAFIINELSTILNFLEERRKMLCRDNNVVRVTFFTSKWKYQKGSGYFHTLKVDTSVAKWVCRCHVDKSIFENVLTGLQNMLN